MKKQKLKKIIPIALSLFMIFIITACGNGGGGGSGSGPRAIPDVERITRELRDDGRSIIPREQTIDNVEILEEITDRDEGRHQVLVMVSTNDREVSYVKYIGLGYNQNEDREWVLSVIQPENQNSWLMSPLVGVKPDLIEASVLSSREQFTLDNDNWVINSDTLESVSISNQNTDLTNNKDVIIVDVVLGSAVMIVKGQIELEFVFNNGWGLRNHQIVSLFEGEIRPTAMFDLTTDQLLTDLTQNNVPSAYNQQPIEITQNNVSNISIIDFTERDKKSNRTYDFSLNIKNGIITFDLTGQVSYQFDSGGGWAFDRVIGTTTSVNSVDLEGTRWVGTYNIRGYHTLHSISQNTLTIEITNVGNDGAVSAILTGSPPQYSQSSIGTIDFDTLALNLIFDEWIEQPTGDDHPFTPPANRRQEYIDRWIDFHQINIVGSISVDGTTISRSSGMSFEVSLDS
jgi:hypothetical protein